MAWYKKLIAHLFLLITAIVLIVPTTFVEGGNSMELTSKAFKQGEKIPTSHTCDFYDFSPPLSWTGAPTGTESFALICDDPDTPAGTWIHWVIYNIPAKTTHLSAGVEKTGMLSNGTRQGKNDFRRIGYGGPCSPPQSGYHRYFFKLYALDTKLGLESGATKVDVVRAMDGHVLSEAKLMGKYKR